MKESNPEILRFDSVDSTNHKAKELLRSGILEKGSVVVANTQTAGRGSGNRTWHSPRGGLYLSVVVEVARPSRPTDYSLIAGVAMSQAVFAVLPKSVDVTVKWPNDCLVSWKKIGGVLCEAFDHGGKKYCVIGMGLNVNLSEKDLSQFSSNLFPATSLRIETGNSETDPEEVLDVLVKKLFGLLKLYDEQGFGSMQYLWERSCRFIGKKIQLQEPGWSSADHLRGRGLTEGTFVGIDAEGALVLANPKGEKRHYHSGEITAFWL